MFQKLLCFLNAHAWSNVDVKLASEISFGKRITVVVYTYYCKHCNHRKVERRPLY